MSLIAWFSELSKDDIPLVGGKAANLGEMYNAKLPVPPGFVVTAEAFRSFLDSTGLKNQIFPILKDLDVEDNAKLQEASQKIGELIIKTQMPKDIASAITEAYDNLDIDEDIIKKAGAEALSIVKSGRDLPLVAVRSSATAEDLPSISEDEHVLAKVNGHPTYCRMKELYEQIGDGTAVNLEVPSMKGNRLQWTKAQQIYKHWAKGNELYKITTNCGKEITITPNHSLIVLDPDTLTPKTTSIDKLSPNDLIPTVSKLPETNTNQTHIDILDYVKGPDVAEENGMIRIKNKSSNWRIQNGLKRQLEITEELLYFLGIYVAEGCTYKNNEVIITNTNQQILRKAKKFLTSIGIYKGQKINKHSIRVYCKPLVRFLHETTGKPLNQKGKGRSCKIKRVPNFIFGLKKEQIAEFLKGCFDGDGYVSKGTTIEFSSTSDLLSGGITKLLETIGFKLYLHRAEKGTIKKSSILTVNIPYSEAERFRQIIGSEHPGKKRSLNNMIKLYESRRIHPDFKQTLEITDALSQHIRKRFEDTLGKQTVETPHCPICNEKTGKSSKYEGKERYYCADCRKAFYEKEIEKIPTDSYVHYDKKGRFQKGMAPHNKSVFTGNRSLNELRKMLNKHGVQGIITEFNGDIRWEKAQKITPLQYKGWVYDFTVPPTENFVSGIGGIITHNTASFAGQQETYLNVKGSHPLLNSVQKCWASLYTARAIYYRVKNNFPHEKVLIAVAVQKMVNSDKAGVMFSMNPTTNNEQEIIIEGAFGLGEAVVSGALTPDEYIVDKETEETKDIRIGNKEWMLTLDPSFGKTVKKTLPPGKREEQVLNDHEISVLAQLAKRIEHHYGRPQDMEWAIEGSKIYITQSRPVTTMDKIKEKTGQEEEQKDESYKEPIVTGIPASPGVGTGPVKIVREINDLNKIQKGDVLVAEMTNPDYVSAMEKSAAIVTDRGGSTCFAEDTKILTDKGFMNIKDACDNYEDILVPSMNRETMKVEWKPVLAAMKRRSPVIEVSMIQTGNMKGNCLRLTPDHKMITFENRELADRKISEVLDKNEMLLIAQKLPSLNESSDPKLKRAYLLGALMTDGHVSVNNRRGSITFVQKPTEEKQRFIESVTTFMNDLYEKDVKIYPKPISGGVIRGRPINGSANAYCWHSKQAAMQIQEQKQTLVSELLHSDELFAMHFLAGVIDGDGSYNHESSRVNIYVGKPKLIDAVIVSCLRLGIVPQVTVNRTIYNVQIVERIPELLKYTRRVKGDFNRKTNGTRLFSAKQLLSDIIDEVNYLGRTKPYVNKNLLLDSEKIRTQILPKCNEETKKALTKILDSDVRMIRTSLNKEIGETDVYNITVADNHNYIVFTDRFTPVIVNNCHASIVGREMGIPVIVGTKNATEILKEGEIVTVDATAGKVYEGELNIKHEEKKEAYSAQQELETATEVKVIVDLPQFAHTAAETGADGVGLLRSEMMLMSTKAHPAYLIRNGREEELINALVEGISTIAKAFEGKPVWYRTSDIRTDEYRELEGGDEEPEEDNPMMGYHGIRRGMAEKDLLRAEFEAIKKVHDRGFTNVGVMLSLVTHLDQVSGSKELLREVGLEPQENIDFGVMVETPAAVQIIEEICEEGIDFISFGTNDLTQFTLALDRNNENVAPLYDEMHPAVMRQIKHVIDVCRQYNVETSICGQAGSDPEMAELLVKAGIDSISANADAVHKIRNIVAKAEKKILLDVARKQDRNH